MDRYVARLNIEHFKQKLAEETDPAKREMLVRLLAEEEAKLAALEEKSKDVKKS
ncbi:hypothetical protein D3C83_244580 [compost metagenome]